MCACAPHPLHALSLSLSAHGVVAANMSLPPHVQNDIVKQGYLYMKRPPQNGFLRFKSWHKRYFVLRDEMADTPSRLEMYSKETDFVKKRKFVLHLDHVIHVGRSGDSKRFPQAFMIVCSGRAPVMLADDDPLYVNSWLLAVTLIGEKGKQYIDNMETLMKHCNRFSVAEFRPPGELQDFLDEVPLNACYSESLLEEMMMKKYDVTVEATKTSRRNNLEGDYQLIVRSWGLSLVRPGKEDYVVHWPLCFIRKFKSECPLHSNSKRKSTIFSLELGRRCMTGEGVLQFRTRYGREIVADMNLAISHSMSNKLLIENMVKHRSMMKSRLSSKGGSCSTVSRGRWKSMSHDQSSSRGSSLSRQSSSCNRSLSGPSTDGCLHVGDFDSILSDSVPLSRQRSPLRSDSSGESKHQGESGTTRTSVSSLLSTSSMASSGHSSSDSSKSAEYVQAEFPSPERRKKMAGFASFRSHPTRSNGFSRIFSCNSFPPHVGQQNDSNDNTVDHQKERVLKAEAEGYLEVLPDISDTIQNDDGSDDMSNIYHIMDFSKKSKSSPVQSRSSACDEDAKRQPHDSCRTSLESGLTNLAIDKLSLLRKSSGGLVSSGKPPAPLPRPEHTMS